MDDDSQMNQEQCYAFYNVIRYGTLENLKTYFDTNNIPNIFNITIRPDKVQIPIVFHVSNLSKLKYLIKKGFNINYKVPKTGRNILFHNNNYKVVKYLIEQGMDPNIKDNYGNNVLIGLKNLKLVKMYIEKYNVDINHLNQFDGNVLMINKNLHIIKYCVENGCDVEQCDLWGKPNWYFKRFNPEVFKYLIDVGSPIDTMTEKIYNNQVTYTPSLTSLIEIDNPYCLEYVIKKYKNINLNDLKDQDGGNHNGYFRCQNKEMIDLCYKNGLKFEKSAWGKYPFTSNCNIKHKDYLAKLFVYDKLVFWSNRNKLKLLLHRYNPETRKNKNILMNDLLCTPNMACFPGGQKYLEAKSSFYNNIKILGNK